MAFLFNLIEGQTPLKYEDSIFIVVILMLRTYRKQYKLKTQTYSSTETYYHYSGLQQFLGKSNLYIKLQLFFLAKK